MSTPQWIKKHLTQTAVYWGNPQNDGEGGFEFDDPVEIPCRCKYRIERVLTGVGEEAVSRATFTLDQDVDEGGYLFLGLLADIANDQTPESTEGSMRILAFDKIPQLDGRAFLYKAYCNRT